MNSPHLLADGTHEIPVHKVQCSGCELHGHATGIIRWHPETGLTFEVIFPDVSGVMLPRYYRRNIPKACVGKTIEASPDAEWTAQSYEGLVVRLFGTLENPESSLSYGTAHSSSRSCVTGNATFAEVQLAEFNSLAFWNATQATRRLFFIGFDCRPWPRNEEISYQDGESLVTTCRSSLTISGTPRLEIVSAGSRTIFPEAAWFTVPEDGSDPRSENYSIQQSFLSLVNGRRTVFYWLDRFTEGNVISRLYFGWHKTKLDDVRDSLTQPLPLRGIVEAFKYGKDVVDCLPALYGAIATLRDRFDVDWILSPIWTANHTYLDDRVALASVALERLASEWQHLKSTGSPNDTKAATKTWQDGRILAVRNALVQTLKSQRSERGLTGGEFDEVFGVMSKRLENVHQAPNTDRLGQIFVDLGFPLTEHEEKTVANRNRALHGSRTLKRLNPDYNAEAERYDILRMLVVRAVLAVFNYRGPYINYAGRPPTGNFPIVCPNV